MEEYDPFVRGALSVGVRTVELRDAARARAFPCEIWYPALLARQKEGHPRHRVSVNETRDAEACAGVYPLIGFSHSSGGGRRQSSFLCGHIASHGYVVGALDHLGARKGKRAFALISYSCGKRAASVASQ